MFSFILAQTYTRVRALLCGYTLTKNRRSSSERQRSRFFLLWLHPNGKRCSRSFLLRLHPNGKRWSRLFLLILTMFSFANCNRNRSFLVLCFCTVIWPRLHPNGKRCSRLFLLRLHPNGKRCSRLFLLILTMFSFANCKRNRSFLVLCFCTVIWPTL